MSKVKGKRTEYGVEIEISCEEALGAIADEFGLKRIIFGKDRDKFWRLEKSDKDGSEYLQKYEDYSCHGSSDPRPCQVGGVIDDQISVSAYKHIQELNKLLNQRN